MAHRKWLTALIAPDSLRKAAQRIGKAPSTILRQIDHDGLTAEVVIDLCRAYDYSPIDGLVETGYLQIYEPASSAIAIRSILDHATEGIRHIVQAPKDATSNTISVTPNPYTEDL